jgi:SAM-dependent methyltransferase
MEPLENAPGSFRDPASRVFLHDGQVFRGVDEPSWLVLKELAERGLLDKLVADGLVIGTELVEDREFAATLAAAGTGFHRFLRHHTVPVLTWPYEWTISMLADAALVTLEAQRRLIEAGYSLKDASAYNVQFVGGRPALIDLGSIERPARQDVWYALGQFSQMFTFPLLLCRHAGWDARSYFLAHLGGMDARRVAAALGRWSWLRPALLWDVTLPAMLTRWAERGTVPIFGRGQSHFRDAKIGTVPARNWDCPLKAPRAAPSPPTPLPQGERGDAAAQLLNLKRLRRKIARLAAGYRPQGTWVNYTTPQDAKLESVKRFLCQARPQRVLDLGCNTGRYSRLAAECGAEVVAVDADHDAVEVLYRRLREEPAPITPMVVDLCNPSPAIGYMNRERAAWLDRAGADCVLALALLHHLVVSGNLSLEAVCELLCAMTRRDLVLEFVPTDDEKFRRLVEFRIDKFDEMTLARCVEVFGRRFELLAQEPIAGTPRTLLFFRRKP